MSNYSFVSSYTLKTEVFMPDSTPILKETLLLWAIEKVGYLGRYKLVSILELPDGVTRGLLTRLATKGYVKRNKFVGTSLTTKGKNHLGELLSKRSIREIAEIDAGDLGFPRTSAAAHIRGGAALVHSGIEQRDAAIRSGAVGAITMIFHGGKLLLPPDLSDASKKNRRITDQLKTRFKLSEGDVLIIGSANSRWRAVEGVLRAAETLTQSNINR